MAENKKSFLIYCDLIHTVEKLSDADAGLLFKHALSYVNDKNPKTDNLLIEIAFEPIKQALKRDLQKYENIRQKNIDNANKRWNKNNATASDRIPSDTKNAVNDIVSVSDSVNDNVKKEKESALNFLKSKAPSRLEAFIMQQKQSVTDWKMMVDTFNDQIDLEIAQNKISFNVDELMPRLSKWCRSWIKNQDKSIHSNGVRDDRKDAFKNQIF